MKRCPITYDLIKESERYSERGLKMLSPALKDLQVFPYSADDQRREAEAHATKMSIQGVQPKLSAKLNVKKGVFEIVDRGGRFILKPQVNRYRQLPENEDLTMRMANLIGIEVPLHGMIYSKDNTLTYFIRRFDRRGQKQKIHVEDFAQLSGESRDTKYESSMERVAQIVEKFCTFPMVEKLKLFERTIFSFLIGNEDMHLKNFSLIGRDDKIELAPAYDMVNTTIVLAAPKEQMALSIKGKKSNLTRNQIINYFGKEYLNLNSEVINILIAKIEKAVPVWRGMIGTSFLDSDTKKKYAELLTARCNVIELSVEGDS